MIEDFSPIYQSREELLTTLTTGVTLITGNQRAALTLQAAYARIQAGNGQLVWESADILNWNSWLQRCFIQIASTGPAEDLPLLLTDMQERIVWEKIISTIIDDDSLLQLSQTARHCMSSWKLIQDYEIKLQELAAHSHDEHQFFVRCCRAFSKQCKQNNWLTMAQLQTFLCQSESFLHSFENTSLFITGFDELKPQQKTLLSTLRAANHTISWIEHSKKDSSVLRLSQNDSHAEILAAARWSRQIVEQQPQARVGIVVAELSQLKSRIQTLFDRVMTSSAITSSGYEQERPFNISLGSRLSQYPLIQVALLLLRWQQSSIAIEDISVLLHSPYVKGWQEERYARAHLARQLNEFRQPEITLKQLTGLVNKAGRYHCPLWFTMMTSHQATLKMLPARDQASNWLRHFSEVLSIYGFLQGRSLDSAEYQTAEAWQKLLIELNRVDSISSYVTRYQAWQYLSQAASDSIFQPQSKEVPIQILGVLEAQYLQFDYLWVMGLHDGNWPPASQPDAFIPLSLQRKYDMPHNSAVRELSVAQSQLNRLNKNADEVILSYPGQQGDEILRPSALIADYPEIEWSQLDKWSEPLWSTRIFQAGTLESWQDEEVALGDHERIFGGSQVLKLQSLCPFRAFAVIRLGASTESEVSAGLDMAERGNLLHSTLELFWQQTIDSANLLKLTTNELQQRLQVCVERALKKVEAQLQMPLNKRFRQLEKQRLIELVQEWLLLEKQRLPFKVVDIEKKINLPIKHLSINIKIDRVDELESGGHLLIDYKTGKVSPRQWQGDRPEDPQLPLYSMSMPDELSGLLFAQVRANETCLNGISQQAEILPSSVSNNKIQQLSTEEWSLQTEEWRESIESLAEGFVQGYAKVDPVNFPATCRYCSLSQVCRINEVHPDTLYSDVEDMS